MLNFTVGRTLIGIKLGFIPVKGRASVFRSSHSHYVGPAVSLQAIEHSKSFAKQANKRLSGNLLIRKKKGITYCIAKINK